MPNFHTAQNKQCAGLIVSTPKLTPAETLDTHCKAGSRLDCTKLPVISTVWPSGLPCLSSYALTPYFNPSRTTSKSSQKFSRRYGAMLTQDLINKVTLRFLKRLRACVNAGCGHFEVLARFTGFVQKFENHFPDFSIPGLLRFPNFSR